ncbi:tyrosine-type recombinase/integrase [Companilactobacillus ginsenosidimutans]|uniref:Integrase n=1 Tax=Companilactobacillus ginsenosidimutans TaxID=1007676 RepID=A0A0H4QJG0_9LACO|nr:tyrosine-type recombinase/integrase [Companilactobacillus ginsenosidimutans]AKP67176.1 integrase [Companilactobacillus ginsenosidimutans]
MVSYQKRGNVWQYEISYKDVDGKYKKLRKSGFIKKSEAVMAASLLQSTHPNLYTVRSGDETLVSYFDRWINVYKKGKVSEITYNKYQNTSQHASELFGNLKLKEITKLIYQKKLNEFGKTHARRTVSCLHKQLRACILDAIDERIIVSDPTRKAVIVGIDPPKKLKSLNYNQWKKLVSNLNTNRSAEMIIYIACVTGMRYGEIVGLTVNDFNYSRSTLHINKTWDYKYKTGFKKTKTKSSNREIIIDKSSANKLRQYIRKSNLTSDDLLFMDSKKHVMVSAEINKVLTGKLKDLKIPRITFHGLRHTHASILLYKGVSTLSVSRRLGHSSVSTTQSTYLHIIKELEYQDQDKIISILNIDND